MTSLELPLSPVVVEEWSAGNGASGYEVSCASSDSLTLEPVSRGRILVVEDEDIVRGVVVEMLEATGFEVEAAENGTVALEKLRTAAPVDVLFTDIVMPNGPNGVELARLACAAHPRLKVLLASGYARHILVGREGLTDTMRFIPKPYRLAHVLQVLGQLMASDV